MENRWTSKVIKRSQVKMREGSLSVLQVFTLKLLFLSSEIHTHTKKKGWAEKEFQLY